MSPISHCDKSIHKRRKVLLNLSFHLSSMSTEKVSTISSICKQLHSNVIEKRRLVSKNGQFRANLTNVQGSIIRHYIRDAFTTLVDAKWRWSFLIFILGFILTWLIFTFVYWSFAFYHGDIKYDDPYDEYVNIPCIANVYDFTTAFLFSVETQHTIGYGSRHVTAECPHAVFAVFLQFIIGIGVQCLTAALIFTKLQTAKGRKNNVMFSKKACIGEVDGEWRLMVRVGDFSRSKLVAVKVIGLLVKRIKIPNSKTEHFEQDFITFESEGGNEVLSLLWPSVVYHTIDTLSPLWPPEKITGFGGYHELIIMLEGSIESTSQPIQVRTSYLPREIQMGYKFQQISPQVKDDGKYHCSYFDIDTTCPVLTDLDKSERKLSKDKRLSRASLGNYMDC